MEEKFVYFNHHRKVYTVVEANTFLMLGECRPHTPMELSFAKEHDYKEVSITEYKSQA